MAPWVTLATIRIGQLALENVYIAYLATKIKLLNGFKADILEIIEFWVAILFFNQDGGLGDPYNYSHWIAYP